MKRQVLKRLIWVAGAAAVLMASGAYAQDPANPQADPQQQPAAAQQVQDEADASASKTEPVKSIYDDEKLKPRDIYNLALEQLNNKAFDIAIDGFSRARNDALTFDNDLRYASSYNLAHAYAQRAAAAGDVNNLDENALNKVIEDMTMSVAWFRDAAQQRPSMEAASGNLEIMLKRLLAAKDVMAQKYNTLEKQLDGILAVERAIRENSRVLSERLVKANANRDPVAFQDDFKGLAKIQREALTQTNLTAENLENALMKIESKAEDQRTQEEAFRGFQLKSADPLLESARQAMAGARRQLRDLSIDDALRLTNKAFNMVKQAREQLENPLAVLGHIMEDETGFVRIASAKQMYQTPELFEKYKKQVQRDDLTEPPWLTVDLLSDNQIDTLVRTNRLVTLLRSAVTEAAAQQQEPQDPKQAEAEKEQREQIKEALPFVENAASSMQIVTQKLEASDFKGAVEEGGKAIEQLSLAMERFADLKHLIEIAYASHSKAELIVRGELGEQSDLLSRAQQREFLGELLKFNIDRLERLASLLSKEAAKANQQAMPQQGGQQGAPSEEQLQQIQQLFEHAENLRAQALGALQRMNSTVSEQAPEGVDETIVPQNISDAVWSDLTADADEAHKSLEELRILFFTVVEHIQELLRQQTKTMDQTTDAASETSEAELAAKLAPIVDRQRMHEITSDKLSEVLTKQAEEIQAKGAGQQPQGGQDPAEIAQRYRQAASELQVASTSMRQIQNDLQAEKPLFTESLEGQKTAIEHIQKALEYLQPPQQQQQQQQQEQQQQQQQQQKMSKEQIDKKIQQIRSRDQERRKSKDARAAGMPTVEKDW